MCIWSSCRPRIVSHLFDRGRAWSVYPSITPGDAAMSSCVCTVYVLNLSAGLAPSYALGIVERVSLIRCVYIISSPSSSAAAAACVQDSSCVYPSLAVVVSNHLSGPHTVVEKSEVVPFGTCLGLEVPEDPALTALLIGVDLCSNVVPCVVSHGLVPLVDEVLGGAGADKRGREVRAIWITLRVCAIVPCTNTVAVLM